jgi:hypothetical protein
MVKEINFYNQSSSAKNTTLTPLFEAIPFSAYK